MSAEAQGTSFFHGTQAEIIRQQEIQASIDFAGPSSDGAIGCVPSQPIKQEISPASEAALEAYAKGMAPYASFDGVKVDTSAYLSGHGHGCTGARSAIVNRDLAEQLTQPKSSATINPPAGLTFVELSVYAQALSLIPDNVRQALYARGGCAAVRSHIMAKVRELVPLEVVELTVAEEPVKKKPFWKFW